MADHEELEGDNTPETSPRDEKEPIVENDVGEDKVIIPCLCQRGHVKKEYLVIMLLFLVMIMLLFLHKTMLWVLIRIASVRQF